MPDAADPATTPPEPSVTTASPAARLLLLGLLIGAVVANVAQLPWLEADAPRATLGSVWYRNAHDDLSLIVQEESAPDNVRERYLLPLYLREETPGVTVARPADLPPNQLLRPSALIGLGGLTVNDRDTDGQGIPDLDDLGGMTLLSGEGGSMGEPFEVRVADTDVTTLVVRWDWDPLRFVLIDERLLDGVDEGGPS